MVSLPADGSRGIAIDLRAPFGYMVPSGVIRTPQIAEADGTAVFPPPGGRGLELPVGIRVRAPALVACQVMRRDGGPPCRLTALPPGSHRAAAGMTAMPDVSGLGLADALDELVHAGLGLSADAGWVVAWSPEAHERMVAEGEVLEAGDDPPTVAEFREAGLAAFLRHPLGPGGRGLLLGPGEGGSTGEVVAQYPPAGTRVRRGTPVVVAAVRAWSRGGAGGLAGPRGHAALDPDDEDRGGVREGRAAALAALPRRDEPPGGSPPAHGVRRRPGRVATRRDPRTASAPGRRAPGPGRGARSGDRPPRAVR